MDINSQASAHRRAVLLVHAAFVLNGIVVTMLGPLVPILSAKWTMSDAAAGGLFTGQFAGSTLGVALSSFLLPRRGFRFVLSLGLFWMAIGVGALRFAGWPAGIAAVFFYGMGFGIAIPTGNVLISKMYEGRDAGPLNLLNMSWGIGAVCGPIVIALLVRSHQLESFYPGLATALLVCGLWVAFSPIRAEANRKSRATGPTRWDWATAAYFASLFFLYVGSENAFSGWVASHARRISDPGSIWALTPSFFWITLVGGRGIAPFILRHFSAPTVATGGLIVGALGCIGLIAAHGILGSVVSALIAGVGFAPVYPIVISAMSRRYGDQAERAAGLMFAMAGVGASIMPWLVGFVSDRYGSLRLGLTVPLAGLVLMLLLRTMDAHNRASPQEM